MALTPIEIGLLNLVLCALAAAALYGVSRRKPFAPGAGRQPADAATEMPPQPIAHQAAPEPGTPVFEIARLRRDVAAMAARAGRGGADEAKQMQPELIALRARLAELAGVIARQQEKAQQTVQAAPEIDALRKEIAALQARLANTASGVSVPQAAAIPRGRRTVAFWPVAAAIAAAIAIGCYAGSPRDIGSGLFAGPNQSHQVSSTVAPKPASSLAQNPGRRVALVIGNGNYRNAPRLTNPARDADAIVGVLKAVGFQSVTRYSDLSRERMNDVLRSFAGEAADADWALVYFAGHGMEIGGTNYLVPTDARLATDTVVSLEAVSLDNVLTAVGNARRLRLVLLDACRDNPFLPQMKRSVASRSIGRGLGRVEPEPGTLVVFAAKHGETALDDTGQNSPFAAALVKRLATPGLEVRRLFDHVRDDVIEVSGKKQEPFNYGSLSGREDFYFVSTK